MHSEKIFFENFCVQMTILIPGTIGKWSVEKKTSILDSVCFDYEQLFHSVQCTACRLCRRFQYISKDKLVLSKMAGILSFSDQLHYLWAINCVGNGTLLYSIGLFYSGSLHILFSYHFIFSILGKIILHWNQPFQCLAIVAFQLQLV